MENAENMEENRIETMLEKIPVLERIREAVEGFFLRKAAILPLQVR